MVLQVARQTPSKQITSKYVDSFQGDSVQCEYKYLFYLIIFTETKIIFWLYLKLSCLLIYEIVII